MGGDQKSWIKSIRVFLAGCLSPWILFGSFPLALFATRIDDFLFQKSLLLCFGFLFGLWVVCLQGVGFRGRLFVLSLLAGPAFLVYNLPNHLAWPLFWDLLWFFFIVGTVALCAARFQQLLTQPRTLNYFALCFLCLFAVDSYRFSQLPTGEKIPATYALEPKGPTDLPNIYHVVLDMYESDYFYEQLDEALTQSLTGFHAFFNNLSLFETTRFSLISTFSGELPDAYADFNQYFAKSVRGPDSLLGLLKRKGYQTFNVNSFWLSDLGPEDSFYDYSWKQGGYDSGEFLMDDAFFKLWIYSFWPRILFYGKQAPRFSSKQVVISHLKRFRKFLELESNFSEQGRYNFIHLVLPHSPFVLREDCSYPWYLPKQPAISQFRCATKLIEELVGRLKELGRYEKSIIYVHGDHGYLRKRALLKRKGSKPIRRYLPKGKLFDEARIRSLLLYKPAGTNRHPLQIHTYPTSLLDIAPTLYQDLREPIPSQLAGTPLLNKKRPVPFFYRIYKRTVRDMPPYPMEKFQIRGNRFVSVGKYLVE